MSLEPKASASVSRQNSPESLLKSTKKPQDEDSKKPNGMCGKNGNKVGGCVISNKNVISCFEIE